MWKLDTDNKTLPSRFPPMDGQQKETQYPEWHKDTTGKRLWGGENNEDPQGNKDNRGNILRAVSI